ncbi:sensor domain-containing diguanylate cyclase [Comamonas testosteroni]|uniref:GGDEF domain-containing protein n=1 Tax=Comamonas testosteroni TaxID=285 RepID=UPI0015FE2132|nr:GGDEF domain-containing protein [Comamonas testosteroni]WEE79728.1 GGDEF domain-containing protein [Comamonas testosteroni]
MFTNKDFFVLTPSLAIVVLATILLVVWLFQRSQRFLIWQACAYSLTALTLGAQTLLPLVELNRYALLIGSFYLISAWCLAKSWAERWGVSTRPQIALLIAIITLAALYQFSRIDPNIWARVSAFSIGSGLVLLLPILQIGSKKNSFDWLDKALLWLSSIFTAYTLTRPVLIWLLEYTDLSALPRSPYWIFTLLSILNFALLFTVLMSAIAVKETVGKLRKERDFDALTQILNRRSFPEHAQKRLDDPRLYPMAVLACDIDHFKRINDAWGHERGDMVLQLVSSTLKNNLREHDLVARLGGEEFVLLLADITLREAELIAQRIQRDLGSKNTVLPTGPKLTMSFGISSITKPSQFEQAMKEADQLLYQAKNAGRDRVHVSGVFYPDISVDIHQQWNRPAI